MLMLKDGVLGYCRTGCVRPPVWDALIVTNAILTAIGKDCVITSLCDGRHSRNSKHYEGNAFDLRNRHLTDIETADVAAKLKESLGIEYDVVVEETHIHVEYDPK